MAGPANLCNWHYAGVPQGFGPRDYFSPGCKKCEQKRADGIVTGSEPRPSDLARVKKKALLSGMTRANQTKRRAIAAGRYCEYKGID